MTNETEKEIIEEERLKEAGKPLTDYLQGFRDGKSQAENHISKIEPKGNIKPFETPSGENHKPKESWAEVMSKGGSKKELITPESVPTADTQITQEIEKQYEGLSKKEIKELERDAYFQLQKKFVYVEMLKAKLEGFQLGKSQALKDEEVLQELYDKGMIDFEGDEEDLIIQVPTNIIKTGQFVIDVYNEGYKKALSSQKKKFENRFNEDILFYAFRYALGRMTYAVKDVTDYIILNKNLVSNKTKELIIKEIDIAIKEKNIGMDCDLDRWEELKQKLQEMK